MSTAGEIIVQAFREGNFTPVGAASTAEELTEAIPRLNSLVFALLGEDVGEELREWTVPQAWSPAQEERHPLTPLTGETTTVPYAYLPENVRVNVTITGTRTLYLPGIPSDGARFGVNNIGSSGVTLTLHANGRLIAGAAQLSGTPASFHGRSWMYRADLGNWIELVQLVNSASEIPFPEEYDDFFVTGLYMRLARRFGKEVSPEIAQRNESMLARIQRRYKARERPLSAAELREYMRRAP